MDFTEARLAVKLDPSRGLLRDFVALNNRVLSYFTRARRPGAASTPARVATRTR
jgi:hypothetical protein